MTTVIKNSVLFKEFYPLSCESSYILLDYHKIKVSKIKTKIHVQCWNVWLILVNQFRLFMYINQFQKCFTDFASQKICAAF